MDETTPFYKDGITRILELLKATFGVDNYTFFDGDPEEIPSSLLPAICVSEPDGEITTHTSATDNIFENVIIKIIFNKNDDLGASPDVELTEYKLRKMVKGQDPSTGEYMPTTLMYALRTNITLSNVVLSEKVKTQFDVNIRGQLLTQEAWITVSLRRLAMTPNRV